MSAKAGQPCGCKRGAQRDNCPNREWGGYDLGPEWLAIAGAIRTLLNGELGRLDGGTLDGLLFDLVEAAGFSRDDL